MAGNPLKVIEQFFFNAVLMFPFCYSHKSVHFSFPSSISTWNTKQKKRYVLLNNEASHYPLVFRAIHVMYLSKTHLFILLN